MFSNDRYASEYFSSQTQPSYPLGTLPEYRCVVVFIHCLNKMCVVHNKNSLAISFTKLLLFYHRPKEKYYNCSNSLSNIL